MNTIVGDAANLAPGSGSEEAFAGNRSSKGRSRHLAAKSRVRKPRKRLVVALIESRSLIRDALAHRFRAARRDCRILVFSNASDLLDNGSMYKKVELVLLSACSTDTSSDETLEVVRRLSAASRGKHIVIFSDRDDAVFMTSAIRHGARGYIPTNFDLPVAMAAVEVVLAGGIFAPATTLIQEPALEGKPAQPLSGTRDSAETAPPEPRADATDAGAGLTLREGDVLGCVAQGKSNKVIARDLRMREGTVKVHLRHLMRKLNATNRTQLALRTRPARGSEQVSRQPTRQGGSLLYAEDDDQVREPLAESMRQAGFTVFVARDGYEAISVLKDNHVDLLLADVVMPGLSGFELAQQAKQLRPDLHILYVSGYDEAAQGRKALFGKLLRKPLRAAQLVEEICSVLGG